MVGGLYVIIIECCKLFYYFLDFWMLGFEFIIVDIVVVKIGYFEFELYEFVEGWIFVLIFGGVD